MNTLHVLTTGSSLLDKIEHWAQDSHSSMVGALVPGAVPPDTVHEMLSTERTAADNTLNVQGLLQPVQRSLLAAASPEDAAEWTSVHAVRSDGGFATPDAESYLFLASDTDKGLRAATFLAVGHDPRSVHYVPEPLDHGGQWILPEQAWICRIPRLDLGTTGPTGHTWRSLGAAGRLVANTVEQDPRNWTVMVHFSGGYKAIVPYVMILAEAIRSRLRTLDMPVRAVALHESSVRLGNALAVEVPVRHLSSNLWADVETLRAAMRPDSDEVPASTASDRLVGLMVEPGNAHRTRVTAPGLISTHVL